MGNILEGKNLIYGSIPSEKHPYEWFEPEIHKIYVKKTEEENMKIEWREKHILCLEGMLKFYDVFPKSILKFNMITKDI